MRFIKIFLLLTSLFIFFTKPSYSATTQRAYFRINSESAFTLIEPYLQHKFEEKIFSIQAPDFIINRLKANQALEFRGYATLWKVSSHLISSRQPSCSPSTQIPWGVSKVGGGSGGADIKVAVLDTGVNVTHPDLKNNIVDCKDTQSSLVKNSCSDGNGHGTHVAGIIAANGKIKGVAPLSKIMAVKVCSNSGYCWSDDVARGIRYAADNGAKIINLSVGGSSLSNDEKLAIDYAVSKGLLVVAAAGNDGPKDNTIDYPAAYHKVVAVGVIDQNNLVATFSSRGNNYFSTAYLVEEKDIEFVSPGVSVESTYSNGCYKTYSGTSMASPHIAGLASKLWAGSADATRVYLQQRAQFNFSDVGRTGDDPDAGFGFPSAP